MLCDIHTAPTAAISIHWLKQVVFSLPILATALKISPELSNAELRTAIATENLTSVTIGLLITGILTLIAAIVAAVAAVRTYVLEAKPALAIYCGNLPNKSESEQPHLLQIMPLDGQMSAYVAECERPISVDEQLRFYIFVRNVGRSPIIEAKLNVRATVSEWARIPVGPSPEQSQDVKYIGRGTLQMSSPKSAVIPV